MSDSVGRSQMEWPFKRTYNTVYIGTICVSHVKYSFECGNNPGAVTWANLDFWTSPYTSKTPWDSLPKCMSWDNSNKRFKDAAKDVCSARSWKQVWRLSISEAILKYKKECQQVFGRLAEKLLTFLQSPPKFLSGYSDSIKLLLIQKSGTKLGSEYPTFKKNHGWWHDTKTNPSFLGGFLATMNSMSIWILRNEVGNHSLVFCERNLPHKRPWGYSSR